jgi:aldehyde:ferredoxin oxidoreductase
MARLFNMRMGLTSADDTLPERMFSPLGNGQLKGHAIDRQEFADALPLYYEMMGWDEAGAPRYGKLVELGIETFAPAAAGR